MDDSEKSADTADKLIECLAKAKLSPYHTVILLSGLLGSYISSLSDPQSAKILADASIDSALKHGLNSMEKGTIKNEE